MLQSRAFTIPRPMKTFIRIICLGLCLALAAPATWGRAEESQKKSSKSKSESKSQSKSKSKSKNGSKSKKEKEASKDKNKSKSKRKSSSSKTFGEGFRGLAWGSPLSVLKDPDLREEEGELKYYTVPGDDMDVLDVHMREIVYVFCHGKLAGALTRYDGQVNHLALLGRLKDTYGTPLESLPNVRGDRSWRFDVEEGVSIMMEFAEDPGTGALAWMAQEPLAACQQPAP